MGSRSQEDDGRFFVFTREAVRALDRACIDEAGLPGLILMENAARAVADECLEALDIRDGLVLIICGGGNNGGDGLAAARLLDNAGVRTRIALLAPDDRLSPDAAVHARVARSTGLGIDDVHAHADGPAAGLDEIAGREGEPDLIVDAILGTGADRPLDERMRSVVSWINRRALNGAFVVAVDVPTGLDCDTGEPLTPGAGDGGVVRADVTVTLAGLKEGLLREEASGYVGEVVVGDIGAPRSLMERFGRPYEPGA